ncbi:MAG: PAS domain S-box protein [Geobacteraceae bacterium]|nr:PAS domain S-box protein [Geobacteraceae bacterium]
MTAYHKIFLRTPWRLVLVFLLFASCQAVFCFIFYENRKAWLMCGITVTLTLASGAIVLFIWRQTQMKHLREICDVEREHLALAQQYEALTRFSNDGILLLAADGGIVETNERAVSLYGYSWEELLQLNIRDLKVPENWSDLDEKLALTREHGGIMFESLHRRKNGETVPVEISSRILLIEGKWFYLGIIRDISERRSAEAQVIQKHRELENLNRTLEDRVREEVSKNREKDHLIIQQGRLAAMGEMIGNIAHQWRQPLNVVGLLFQSLQEMHHQGELTGEQLNDTVCQAMEVIRFMSQTMDDFRNFFKPDKEKKDFSVKEVVNRSLSFLRPHLNYHNISVEVNIDKELVVTGYPNEYAQVLINILGNSKDVILERDTENPVIIINAHRESNRTIVTIQDNAGGIADDIIGKIFDPYFTTKRTGDGSGLGLYMSKTIIEKNMLGSLSAANTAAGAEFRIEV